MPWSGVRLPPVAPDMDMMCQLPDAGMKLPNSIGGRSGLDSHCCPPKNYIDKVKPF